MSRYVLLATEDIQGIDLGFFDFDLEANMFFYVMTDDEQLLMRYGGRDSRDALSFYSRKSAERALERGLEKYQRYREGRLAKQPRPAPRFLEDYKAYSVVANRMGGGGCVRCHHVAEAEVKLKQQAGRLDKMRDLWGYPDGASLGLSFDVDAGTALRAATGAASAAGLRAGDELVEVEGQEVLTYADVQYRLHKVAPSATKLGVVVRRGDKRVAAALKLPEYWKASDLLASQYKFFVVEPFPQFWARRVGPAERKRLGLREDGLAVRVTHFWAETPASTAGLLPGDVVYAVDGAEQAAFTQDARVWIRLKNEPGDRISLGVLRGSARIRVSYALTEGQATAKSPRPSLDEALRHLMLQQADHYREQARLLDRGEYDQGVYNEMYRFFTREYERLNREYPGYKTVDWTFKDASALRAARDRQIEARAEFEASRHAAVNRQFEERFGATATGGTAGGLEERLLAHMKGCRDLYRDGARRLEKANPKEVEAVLKAVRGEGLTLGRDWRGITRDFPKAKRPFGSAYEDERLRAAQREMEQALADYNAVRKKRTEEAKKAKDGSR